MIQVDEATSATQLDAVRTLMREFVAWHRVRHAAFLHLIDAYFDPRAYEEELARLPGKYQPPAGSLLLATVDGQPAGCVAMRPIADGCCEMKRMFVYPRFHGLKVGEALARTVIERGRSAGYRAMRLDTGVLQVEAIGLYKKLGFAVVEPYYQPPAAMKGSLLFMERPYPAPE